ncbi:EpsG family protein [Aerococcus sp. HMSC10H05]|uniref:EpsG family protein n=1 Tax=Aerococcus sp. HMSC10H05 TaxID=1581084 RepID=UPI0008A6007F|nr:EpsG family protein [Aerococcus sp. HMSC10H05]OFU49966.1 hypothetical protein HMPREF3116_06150 [Aerococcus sp. HMSC10H05]
MVATILQYIFIFLVLILSAFLGAIEKHLNFSINLKKITVLLLIIIISCSAAIRTIGTDTENYVNIYLMLPRISNLNINLLLEMSYEPGFVLLASLLKSIGIGIQGFFFLFSFIPLVIISSVIFKVDNKNAFLLFFIFISFFILRGPLDIIRQFFAMSILLKAFYDLSENNSIKYYLNSFASILFHYSTSITLFIRRFLERTIIRKSNYVLISLVIFLIGVIARNFILSDISRPTVTFPALNKVVSYLSSSYQYDNTIHFISRILLEHSLPWINIGLIIFLTSYSYIIQLNRINLISFNSMLVGSYIYFFCMGLGESTIAVRLSYMFSIGIFILIKDLLIIKPNKIKYIIWILVIILYNLIVLNYYSNAYKLFY